MYLHVLWYRVTFNDTIRDTDTGYPPHGMRISTYKHVYRGYIIP